MVTTYEFKPDAGVKYSKITGLADDLCLAMQAESVLIDRIPGKSTVGIQIPNHTREQISLRELLESDIYRRSASKLTIALGKTIHGEPYMADLATMPHLLIAGSTGTGKSVGINSMLTSILYRATPDDVRMIMIDPKRLELGMYEDIPHLLTPVVVDPKQAANALRWAVREMEERYKTLAAEGVRNIEQYNRNVLQAVAEKRTPKDGEYAEAAAVHHRRDRRARRSDDGGEQRGRTVDRRLAQMARAVGIHLILATQRPSVDVITGLIKANMPARISFRVSSKIDSRTILDGNGAEQLLGKGDMLFLPPASSRFIRLHGPYISEQESARLASFLRKQGKPTYDETITAEEKTHGRRHRDGEGRTATTRPRASSSRAGRRRFRILQRRLRIGFSRAARLVDMMEMEGLVSPAAGGKPREVLVDKSLLRRGGCAAAMTADARVSTVIASLPCCMGRRVAAACADDCVAGRSPPVESLFADASREGSARCARRSSPSEPLTDAAQGGATVVADYENVVRHYPASGFCDDALWRAAELSRDAFEEFHEARERATALRLLQLLQTGYPSSRLAKLAPEQVAWLNAHPAKAGATARSRARSVVDAATCAASTEQPARSSAASPSPGQRRRAGAASPPPSPVPATAPAARSTRPRPRSSCTSRRSGAPCCPTW